MTNLLPRDLYNFPHKGGVLTVAYPAFGYTSYSADLEGIERKYFHSKEKLIVQLKKDEREARIILKKI